METKLKDTDVMPYGKHKGEALEEKVKNQSEIILKKEESNKCFEYLSGRIIELINENRQLKNLLSPFYFISLINSSVNPKKPMSIWKFLKWRNGRN